ncbi:MAG: SpoIIE family protein phosphatase [Methyloglobulus sp.]|nr:PAS domain S-box protein [Methyloglobulus sp.]
MQQQINDFYLNIIIVELSLPQSADAGFAAHIKLINSAAARLLGYQQNELIFKPIEIILEAVIQQDVWQSVLTNSTHHTIYTRLVDKTKKKLPALIAFSILSDINAEKIEVLLVLNLIIDTEKHVIDNQDTGNQNHFEDVLSALRESEERFRQMAEMTGEWLWEQDPLGFYIYSSTAVNQILGFSQDYVLGKHYTEFLTLADKASQQSYSTNQQPFYALVNHYQHKDGHEVMTESTGLPIIGTDGKLLKWRGVDHDITIRKHYQDALIDSEKRTRLIIDSSINAIILMDSYGLVTDWNHRAEKMFGWSAQEAIGQRLDDLIIPQRFRRLHRKGLQTFLHTGVGPLLNKQIEQVALRRDGTEFPVEISVSPLKLGNSYIFSGFVHDITDRKAAEQEIQQAQVKLAVARSEINIARQIQASLLPAAPIKTPDFEVTGFCLPADQVGGDYYDYFYRTDEQLDMLIADVSGHSFGPAMFMVEARSAIRVQAKQSGFPANTLRLLNNFLFQDLNKADFFITLFYCQYDIAQQQLRFSNAGHPPPLHYSFENKSCQQLDADGLILGVRENVQFEEKTFSMGNGDVILIYTDGVTEAEDLFGEFFGLNRLTNTFLKHAEQSPQVLIKAILDYLKRFCLREVFNDDITLLVFKKEYHDH